jgi:hypothetical protein
MAGTNGWNELTGITGGREFVVSKIRLKESGIGIEGSFELPPLARLSYEEQVFVAAFVRAHGSIKEMEGVFGVSYPTIKSRLNRLSEKLKFVEVQTVADREDVLARLERGEITAAEAAERLRS